MEHETPVKTKSKTTGITPPGAVSIERFKKNCTACYACVSACPSNIIKPAYTEYGLDGLLLPVLNFSNHYCSYDCKVCTEVCPNDALLPLTLKDKQLTQIGQVRYTPKNCIVYTDGVDCGACDEHCPTKAITMIPFKNSSLYIPKVNYDLCIGCGACEHVCPARPDKAMVIHALEKHGIALLPEKEQQKKIDIDDFGF
jgi:ferredoxin-type protein NapF